MSSSERLGNVIRWQRTLAFKVAASVAVVVLAVAALATYVVQQNRLDKPMVEVHDTTPARPDGAPAETEQEKAAREMERSSNEADARYINQILSARADWTAVAALIVEVAALVLILIWLGLGLSGLGLMGLIALVAWRLKLFQGGVVQLEELRVFDKAFLFVGAAAVLTVSFIVLMEVLKILLSASHPVTAVARNVVAEALRLKISLVFIVLLIFGLAALPGLLDASSPLRYRVQAFLNYSTSGTFWLVALLTVFLSVGSVSFEQRDRIIWQTMTKPVNAWQYILGKWLGVVGIAAVLLLVSGSGIFVSADFLWRQKAVGEAQPFIASGGGYMTEDREILQGQVLTARTAVRPTPPQIDDAAIADELQRRVDAFKNANPDKIADVERIKADLKAELVKDLKTQYFALDPGQSEFYVFHGLGSARRSTWLSPQQFAKRTGRSLQEVQTAIKEKRVQSRVAIAGGDEVLFIDVRPIALRYKIQSGGNDPRATARISFEMPNQPAPIVRVVPLNTTMVLSIPPSAINDEGVLVVRITNGDLNERTTNATPFVFPPDGMEVRFSVGSYQMNFARVILVLWLKLAFLAMAAIAAATFLSFPVASMMAFGILFIAETAGYLTESLDRYDAAEGGHLNIFRLIVKIIAVPIASIFRYYSEINPIENLSDGRLVPWTTLAWAGIIMTGACVVLYAIGVAVFRKRELATYSGQ
ncbi:MAG: ABC transporter permease [Phycisphaerales bacterium]